MAASQTGLDPRAYAPMLISSSASAYLSFSSDVLEQNQMSDYLVRIVQPELQAVPGVQKVQIFGQRTFAAMGDVNAPDALVVQLPDGRLVTGPAR